MEKEKSKTIWAAPIVTSLSTVALITLLGLWFQGALTQKLLGYVDVRQWEQRNIVIDDRFDRLEKYVQDGRVERLVFQKEVIERLVRVEALLAAHMNPVKP